MRENTNKKISTVLGPIEAEALGFCQSHEHLSIEDAFTRAHHQEQCIDDPERSLQEARAYRAAGGAAVVDAQPIGCGRNGASLASIARQSGVHIIASTGFHRMLYYPRNHWIYDCCREELAQLFLRELTEGMFLDADDTPPHRQSTFPAGQVKTALEAGEMGEHLQKLMGAAAKAAARTGAPLMAHIEPGSDPLTLADFLEEHDVSPERMIFCHMDRTIGDIAVHRAVCARGIYLEYDTIAREEDRSLASEIDLMAEMAQAGYARQLLAGLDTTRFRLTAYGGAPGLCFIRDTFLPALERAGLASLAEAVFVHNPARVYAWK